MLNISGGISISHGINIHKLLLKHRQQEGEAVVQTNIQDELMESRFGLEWCGTVCLKHLDL